MKAAGKPDPRQDELALSSVASHSLFPGRSTLYVSEVARALSITPQQVIDLIVCGPDLVGINISANRGGGKPSSEMSAEERGGVPRNHWRIPVSAYDAFLQKRKSL